MKINKEVVNSDSEVSTNNKMRFIRLIESKESRDYYIEYEIASEVRIFGQFEYSKGDVILRFITSEPNRDGLYKYTLYIAAPSEYKLPKYQASKDGYYFQGGGAGEILSLASLYLRCRFFPVAYVFRGTSGPTVTKIEHDFSYIRPQKSSDKSIFSEEERNFAHLGEFFDKVRSFPEELHHGFANAVRLYALAIREIGSNNELAYIHFVSAVEILAKSHTLPEVQDPLLPVMEQIRGVLNESAVETKNELENLFEQRKSTLKFVCFIQKYCGSIVPERPQVGALEDKIYKDTLSDALKKIYRARSKFLHEGSSMYMSISGMTGDDCDYDFSVGQIVDNREFDVREKLPNISFFEGVVRECLLNYLQEN